MTDAKAKRKKKHPIVAKKADDEPSQINLFYKELDGFSLHLPGGRTVVNFKNDEVLINFLRKQYPNWRCGGLVTSIPIGRVPRIFLRGDQMTKELEEKFVTLQKGETGEIAVYKSLMEGAQDYQSGILVLPNVDGNHWQTAIANVEIDTVIVHPDYGVFVLNIKNANRIKETGLASDMEKHTRYIRMIRDYGREVVGCESGIPVHGIVCSYLAHVNESALQNAGYFSAAKAKEMRFVFQPEDMKNFTDRFISILSEIPHVDQSHHYQLEVLVSRLSALNSIEGGVALLHEKMVSNAIHSRQFENHEATLVENLRATSGNDEENVNLLKDEVLSLLEDKGEEVALKTKKRSLILWTKEQMDIIWGVSKALLQPNLQPCRMIVSGPKGSGKTMLLVYIAQLAKQIFRTRKKDFDGDVAVYDGRSGSSLTLFENLEDKLKGTGIKVERSWAHFGPKYLPHVFDKHGLVLLDEGVSSYGLQLLEALEGLMRHQHVILFSSEPTFVKTIKEKYVYFKRFGLTTALRSTGAITRFIEKFRSLDPESNSLPCSISHNLEGEPPEIRIITINTEHDPEQTEYVNEAVNAIVRCAEHARGLKNILVAPFVHPIVLQRIIVQLFRNGFDYEYRNPSEQHSRSIPFDQIFKTKKVPQKRKKAAVSDDGDQLPLPLITFVTGNHVDGSEYGSTVVLIERTLPHFWDNFIFDSLYIALTRTTTKMAFVINNTDAPPIINHKSVYENEDSMPLMWKTLLKPNDFLIPAFEFIRSPVDLFPEKLMEILINSRWQWHPVIVLGKLPPGLELEEQPWPKNEESYYSKNNERKHQHENCCEKSKWYQVGGKDGKCIISLPDFSAIFCHLGSDDEFYFCPHLNHSVGNGAFSAIVFLVYNSREYDALLLQVRRHRFLFEMYENHLGNCPIYILCPFALRLLSTRLNAEDICDQLTNNFRYISNDKEKADRELDESKTMSWEDLKERGNQFCRGKDFVKAFQYYKKSLKVALPMYEELLATPGVDVSTLIDWKDMISKLYTNISKVVFELGTVKSKDITRMETSIQYSEMAVKMNPFWNKSYYRLSKAYEYLGDIENAQKTQKEVERLARFLEANKNRIKIKIVLNEVLRLSKSWESVKFKDNAFLVDRKGNGHFRTIHEALGASEDKPVSLVVNPGVYESSFPIIISCRQVDIIGNWLPRFCKGNKWISGDPPIVIQDIPRDDCTPYSTLCIDRATFYLSRVSVYNWQPDTRHAVAGVNSSVFLNHCSFKSQCGVAISAFDSCELKVSGSRSIGSFSGVQGRQGVNVAIENSYFSKTTKAGVELKEDVTARIQGCTFTHCEGPAIGGTRGNITVDSCIFESNTYRASYDEGAVQLRYVDAVISNSLIQYQFGNGIVIEYGQGTFNNLKIDRCKNSGLLIQAPSIVQDCKITNCDSGIGVCQRIIGGILKIQNTLILRCRFAVLRFSGAPSPEIDGVISQCSNDEMGIDPDSAEFVTSRDISLGKKCYEHSLRMSCTLLEARKVGILDSVLQAGFEGFQGCNYCTDVNYSTYLDKIVVCDRCVGAYYCSWECFEKDKKYHAFECEWTVRVVKLYLNSLGDKRKQVHSSSSSQAPKAQRKNTPIARVSTQYQKKKKKRSQWKKKKSSDW